MNAWLKKCAFNLDLKRERECVWTLNVIRKANAELGAKYEKALPPLVDYAILVGTTKSPEFCDLREQVGL